MIKNLENFINDLKLKNITIKNVDIEKYLLEKRGNFISKAKYVVLPKNTEEVSYILKQANIFLINIVPQGGNTGLVGGSLADELDVILNLSMMDKIIEVDILNKSVTLEAGISINKLNSYLKKYKLEFPLYLPSYKECSIGGNIATNAGGINAIKYGTTRDLVLGIEMVSGSGEILHDLTSLRKRNIGMDIKNIGIGSEGTLGIVTKASLKLSYIKKYSFNVMIGVNKTNIIQKILKIVNYNFFDYIQAFELMNDESIKIVKDITNIKIKINKIAKYNVLIQFKSNLKNCLQIVKDSIYLMLEKMEKNNNIMFFQIYNNDKIWEIRNAIPEAQKKIGFNLKNDFSVSISKIFDALEKINVAIKKFNKKLISVIFGHLGDGNLHINIIDVGNKNNLKEKQDELKQILVKIIMELDGTFSAEHGIGILNKKYLKQYYPLNRNMLIKIKEILDKNLILNKNKLM
jgi:FAD/FMN-containing dehydrogenase